MTNQDFLAFAEMWQATHSNMNFGKVYDQNGMQFVFGILEDYPIQAIQQAVKIYARQNSNAPQPNQIIDLLNTGNKPLSAAEMWAICPKSEAESAVLTIEAMTAWATVSDLYDAGRHYAAEKAFADIYNRLCSESLLKGTPTVWSLSRGSNLSHLESTVNEAARLNRLPKSIVDSVLKSLPAFDRENNIKRLGDSGALSSNAVIELLERGRNPQQSEKNKASMKAAFAKMKADIAESERIENEAAENERKSRENRRETVLSAALERLAQDLSPKELKRELEANMQSFKIPNGLVAV